MRRLGLTLVIGFASMLFPDFVIADEAPVKGLRGLFESLASEYEKQQDSAAQVPSQDQAAANRQRAIEMRARQERQAQEDRERRAQLQKELDDQFERENQRRKEEVARELETRYLGMQEAAFIAVSRNTLIGSVSVEQACKSLLNDMSITQEQYTALLARCISDTESQRQQLRSDLLAKKRAPENCKQWALMRDQSWQNASLNMQYSPMAPTKAPVRFAGKVVDGGPTQLLIQDAQNAALINVPSSSMTFSKASIRVGGYVSGYGTHSSRKLNILVITSACIE